MTINETLPCVYKRHFCIFRGQKNVLLSFLIQDISRLSKSEILSYLAYFWGQFPPRNIAK